MKRKLALTFWAVGSCGAVVFVCWWIFAIIHTQKMPFGAVLMVALGAWCAWEGFKAFREAKHSK